MKLGPTHKTILIKDGYREIKSEAQAYQLIRKIIKNNEVPDANPWNYKVIEKIKVGNWYFNNKKVLHKTYKLTFYTESELLNHISYKILHRSTKLYNRLWFCRSCDELEGRRPVDIYTTEEGIKDILRLLYEL